MKGHEELPLIDVPMAHEERVERLVAAFREQFGRAPEGIAEAPGRVNLIGEHVDYNDGLVLPFAIDRSVMCAWDDVPPEFLPPPEELAELLRIVDEVLDEFHLEPERREVRTVGLYSVELSEPGEEVEIHVDVGSTDVDSMISVVRRADEIEAWSKYVEGVIQQFRLAHYDIDRCDVATHGNVPSGAGLSSSAALELAVGGAIGARHNYQLAHDDLALLCQRAENEYVGVQCGIMDQFASALSKAGHALLIDCRTLAYRHVPLRLAEHGLAVVVANSAVRRELVTSAYNERRRECEEAVVRLREVLGRPELGSLRDVRSDEIGGIETADDDVVLRRARHVVTEIARVAEAVEALERDDFARLGELMVESHLSLKTDYEVSSAELDLLVGLATAQEHVLGARLTGAGFGGCTVNLVRADRVEDFARDVIAAYRERTGLLAVMYVTEACDGLRTWRV